MKLKSVDFLRVLTRRQPLSVLDEHIDTALLYEELQVESCVALRHRSVVQERLPLRVPPSQIELVAGLLRL